ncbi:adenine deaminase [Litchfieldia alkalitelluris]|uniref:adenine deaminase n=1 Tax=Litchfieldia alkalitelluris TaxID=304268 RepID=UPI0038B28D99
MEKHKEKMKNLINVAAKREKADLVIKNGQLIDVFNHDILQGDLAISDGVIVGIGEYEGNYELDANGKFICPSFIDSHVHIESSMVTPSEFAKVVVPHGVTSVIADPHEIANVSGIKGIKFMLDSSEKLPLNVYMMLPSCVPATLFENAGAVLLAEDLKPIYEHPRVVGLGEVMDFPSVAHASEEMLQKLLDASSNGKKIDGHAAGLSETDINIYTSVGIKTDHEAVTAEEAKLRLQRGMYLLIRQGSVAKDLEKLISVVTERNSRRCLFCTDDKHIDDLLYEGSIDHNVRLAIKSGISPITAIQMASINAAECYGLSKKGAIAPGYDADFLILNELETLDIDKVYSHGTLVASAGEYIESKEINVADYLALTESIQIKKLTKEDLSIPIQENSTANIIEIIPNSLLTNHLIDTVLTSNGYFQPSIKKDHLKLLLAERHSGKGNVGLGIVKGLKLQSGAIATTIAHDSHNLIAAGTNDEDLLMAVDVIREIGGGLVVVENQQVLATLPLSISGILSEHDYNTVNEQLSLIHNALSNIGASSEFNPFLTLSFLALPVIPRLKLTDLGLFDVTNFKHINLTN